MVLNLASSFETGLTPGTGVTTANSGGAAGKAFDSQSLTSATCIYDGSTAPGHGGLAITLAIASGGNGYNVWNYTPTAVTTRCAFRIYFRLNASGAVSIVKWQGAGWGINYSGSVLRFFDASGITYTGTYNLIVGVWYRLEVALTVGTTTSNGSVNYRLYILDEPNLNNYVDAFNSGAANLGTTAQTAWIIGDNSATGSAASVSYKDAKAVELGSGFIGASYSPHGAFNLMRPRQIGRGPRSMFRPLRLGSDPGVLGPSVYQVSGTAAILSDSSASVNLLGSVSGAAPVATTSVGDVTALLGASGSAPVVSGASGSPTSVQGVAGSAAVVTTASGTVALIGSVAGAAPIVSTASGAVTELARVAGAAVVVSTASGTVIALLAVSGSALAVTTATGTVTELSPVSGSASAVSTVSGTVTLLPAGGFSVSGTAAVVSSASGAVTLRAAVAGSAAVVSAASGSPTLRAQVSGTAPVVSAAAGTVAARLAISGVAPVVSGVSLLAASLRAAVAGVAAIVSAAYGDVTSTGDTHFDWTQAGGSIGSPQSGGRLGSLQEGGQVGVKQVAGSLGSGQSAGGVGSKQWGGQL